MGRLDASKPITLRDMYLAGVFHSARFGIKILSKVIFSNKIKNF
jgi:hypothetical protein